MALGNLHKFAQDRAASETWSQIAKKEGVAFDAYLLRVKGTSDFKLLSQLARELKSFKGFGGADLTGFQRNMISSAAKQRLRGLGYSS